jgi:hypothetical protein
MGVSELHFTPQLILENSRGFSVNIGFWKSPESSRKGILYISTIGDKRAGQALPTLKTREQRSGNRSSF